MSAGDLENYLRLNYYHSPQSHHDRIMHEIVATKNPKSAYFFAKYNARNADEINILQQVVIDSGHLILIQLFARDIKGADIGRLQSAIVASKDGRWIRVFRDTIPGADKKKLDRYLAVF